MDKLSKSELDEYLAHFSKDTSEDIKKYATESVLLKSRYIFTSREGNQQFGYCTHCNTSFPTHNLRVREPKLINWKGEKEKKTAECPNCKSQCIIKSSLRGRKTMMDEGYFVYYEKSVIDPNAIVAMGIYAVRDYSGEYTNVETKYGEVSIYLFQMGKSSMVKRYCFYGKSYYPEKTGIGMRYGDYEKCKTVHSLCDKDHFANIKTDVSIKSIEVAIKDTPFKYSTWQSYLCGNDMVKFFDLYSKSPCIEYLTKFRLHNLVREKLEGEHTYSSINWRGKTLLKVLKLSKQELNDIKTHNVFITFFFLKVLQLSKKNAWGLSIEEVQLIERVYSNNFIRLQKMLKYGTMKKIINYMSKQCEKFNKPNGMATALITWEDYINDCKILGMNITEENVLYPRNLYTAHQNTISQIKMNADEKLNFKIKERLKSLEKYYLKDDELLIRSAKSSNELIEEGKALSHCVGTYADKYAKGETNIFFVRKVSEPDKPYYTVEVDNKDVIVQVRGKNNRSADEEVAGFINYFRKERLTKKNIKTENTVSVSA